MSFVFGGIILIGLVAAFMLAALECIDAKWCILPVAAFFAHNLTL